MHKYIYYLTSIFRILTGFANIPAVLRIFLKLNPPPVTTLRLRYGGLRLKVRGPMDVWSVKETYLDRFYQRFGFEFGRGWKIIDIGAGLGDFTIRAAVADQGNSVYAFEPFPQSFSLLQENLKLNAIGNVTISPKAVADHAGTLLLNLSSGEPLQFSTEVVAGENKALSVPSLSLADVFQELDLTHCDLLKLDCEGAEYSILLTSTPATLQKISRIVMEYHDLADVHHHDELVTFLSRNGYEVETFRNPVHGDIGYLRAWHTAG